MSSNAQLASMFNRLAAVSQLLGENVFRSIAFARVARALEELPFDIAEAARTGDFPEVEGIGPASRRMIEQYANHGVSEEYEKAVASIPPGLLDMLKIPGLGPKTIALLWKQRGIESVQELELAIQEGKLIGIKGLGERKIATIVDGIRLVKAGIQRRGIIDVSGVIGALVEYMRADDRVEHIEPAGSYRRRRETLGDADLLCIARDPQLAPGIVERFTHFPGCEKMLASGGTKGSLLVHGGFQVDLRVVPRASFGAAMQYFTGSKEHNVKLRGIALARGLTLNEWGLYPLAELESASRKSGEAPDAVSLTSETEQSIYQALGLPFVPPELREDRGEIEAAIAQTLPRLVERADIRGDLHLHTNASDGRHSIEDMARAARAMGYEYLAITDHSQSSVIANGLGPQRLKEHIRAIRRAQDQVSGISILAGSEVDILPDGSLDYDVGLLRELDIVIASPHASLKQDQARATQRLLRAIETPCVNIIGHPTGRLINQREGLPLDISKVVAASASAGVALEINAGWPRWDLCDSHARAARQAGAMIAIDTDAHAIEGLADIVQGIWVARRAWCEAANVLNCQPIDALRAFLKRKR